MPLSVPPPPELKLSRRGLILILGLLSMLMPLSIDMYLPSLPTIARDYQVRDGLVQLTISIYLLGFSVGQLIFGPLADSFGRRRILTMGLVLFIVAAVACTLAARINELISFRFFHGIAAASVSIVVNALMRDIYTQRDEFSRMMSFVMLISNVAPLMAPILGGFLLHFLGHWQVIFVALAVIALFCLILVLKSIPETLAIAYRVPFKLTHILRNFITLFRHRQVLLFMLLGAFSGAGLFSLLSLGPFVYMNKYGVAPVHFGYYFALNIVMLVMMNALNSRLVRRKGALWMLKLGLIVQTLMSLILFTVTWFELGFGALVLSVAGYMGCIAVIGGNSMAIILNFYPYMAGTAASLAGTIRFVIAGLIGVLLAMWAPNSASLTPLANHYQLSEWLMVGSMVACNVMAVVLFYMQKRKK